MDKITQLVCQKNKISYIVFSENLKILEYSPTISSLVDNRSILKIDADVRDVMWELVGLEEKLQELLLGRIETNTIHFPMIMKANNYYDLDIETFTNDEGKQFFIAYLIQKPQESLAYINMIKEINKRTLVYENENVKNQENHFRLINKRLLSFNVDLNGLITSINSAFTLFFHLSKEEIIGVHFSVYFKARNLNINNSTTMVFNAVNIKEEVVSFHADIIPISEDGVVYENIIICQDITYLKQIEKELEFAAGHDSLTGLANRSQLLTRMDDVIAECQSKEANFSICFIDLDKFKPVNDNYGHHAGDMLLKHIAKVLSDFVRKGDMVARIGGDEFIILFDTLSDAKYINTMAKRLEELPKKHPLLYSKEDIIDFGFSLGIATYPQDAINAQELIKIADKKMYLQKRDK